MSRGGGGGAGGSCFANDEDGAGVALRGRACVARKLVRRGPVRADARVRAAANDGRWCERGRGGPLLRQRLMRQWWFAARAVAEIAEVAAVAKGGDDAVVRSAVLRSCGPAVVRSCGRAVVRQR